MERKKKQIENTKQKTKKKQIENTKQKNKKKSYYNRESNPGQPHGCLLYPPLYHSCKHVGNCVKLYTDSNFSITIDTVKVFFEICSFTHDGSAQFSVGVVYSSIKYTHVSVLHGSMRKDSTLSREGAFDIPFHVREGLN